jgi:hypothetical protein
MINFINSSALYFIIVFIVLAAAILAWCFAQEIKLGGRKAINFENYKQKSKLFKPKNDLVFVIAAGAFVAITAVFFVLIALSELVRILLVAYIPIYIALALGLYLSLTRKKLAVSLKAFDNYYQKINSGAPLEQLNELNRLKQAAATEHAKLNEQLAEKNTYIQHKIDQSQIENLFKPLYATLEIQQKQLNEFKKTEAVCFNAKLKEYLNGGKTDILISTSPLLNEGDVAGQVEEIKAKFLQLIDAKIEYNIKKDGLIKCPQDFIEMQDKREAAKFLSQIITHNALESSFTLLAHLNQEYINPINTALNMSPKNETAEMLSLFKSLVLTEFLLGDITVRYENMLVILYNYYKTHGEGNKEIDEIYLSQNLKPHFATVENHYKAALKQNAQIFNETIRALIEYCAGEAGKNEIIEKNKLILLFAECKANLNIAGIRVMKKLILALIQYYNNTADEKNKASAREVIAKMAKENRGELLPLLYRTETDRLSFDKIMKL